MKLTREEVSSVLSSVVEYSGYWLSSIEYNKFQYEFAKQDFIEREGGNPFYEDVLTEMLFNDNIVYIIVDEEEGDDYEVYELSLDKLEHGISKGISKGWLDREVEYYDGPSADAAIQLAIFGEVVYG